MAPEFNRALSIRLGRILQAVLGFLHRNGMMRVAFGGEAIFMKEELARLAEENARLKVTIEELQEIDIAPVVLEGPLSGSGGHDSEGRFANGA